MRGLGPGQLGEDRLDRRGQRQVPGRRLVPPLDLDGAVLEPALADHHPKRHADQVHILEFHSRALVTIVRQDVDPRRLQFLLELPGQVHDFCLVHLQRNQRDLVGRRESGQMIPLSS